VCVTTCNSGTADVEKDSSTELKRNSLH
jgi:hypothetical protein